MVNYNPADIGKRIAACRSIPKRSRAEFLRSDDLQGTISEGTLCKIEKLGQLPPAEFLTALDTAHLGTPDYFLFGEERLPVCRLTDRINSLSVWQFDRFYDRFIELVQEYPEDAVEISDQQEVADDTDNLVSECSLRFKEIRKLRNLTQEETALLLSVNHNTVYANEHREQLPKTHYLLAFCGEMKVSASYILGTHNSLPHRLQLIQGLLDSCSYATQERLIQNIAKIV